MILDNYFDNFFPRKQASKVVENLVEHIQVPQVKSVVHAETTQLQSDRHLAEAHVQRHAGGSTQPHAPTTAAYVQLDRQLAQAGQADAGHDRHDENHQTARSGARRGSRALARQQRHRVPQANHFQDMGRPVRSDEQPQVPARRQVEPGQAAQVQQARHELSRISER